MANDIKTRLTIETDTASVNKARSSVKRMSDDLDAFVAMQDDYIRKQQEVAQVAEQSANTQVEASRRVKAANLDATKGVNAGKFRSGLSTASGLAQSALGDSIGGALGGASDILAAADAIPKLVGGIKGIPQAIGGVVSALGPLGVAVATAGAIFTLWASTLNEEADALASRIQANQRITDLIAQGTTTDQAEVRLASLRRASEAQTAQLEQLKQAYAQIESLDPLSQVLARVFDPREEAIASSLSEAQQKASDYASEIEALSQAMEQGKFATNDLNEALLERASLAGQTVQIEADANERTAEANRERLRQLEIQRQSIEAELEVLKSAETQSAETVARIQQLEKSLRALGNEAEIVSKFTTQTAKDVDNANKARMADEKKLEAEKQRQADESLRREQQSLEQRANAERQFGEKIVDIAAKNAQREEDIARSLQDAQSDARRKLEADLIGLEGKQRQDRINFVVKSQQQEAKSARDHQRNLERIQRNAQLQREDLAANLDFAGLFRLEKNLSAQLEAEQERYNAERDERQIAFEQQLSDLQVSQAQERRERIAAYTQQIADAKQNADRQRRDLQIAKQREEEAARIAYDRQLSLLAEKFNKESEMYAKAGQSSRKAFEEGASGKAAGAGGGIGGLVAPSPSSAPPPPSGGGSFFDRSRFGFGTTNNTSNAVEININGATNPSNTAAAVRDELRKLGF